MGDFVFRIIKSGTGRKSFQLIISQRRHQKRRKVMFFLDKQDYFFLDNEDNLVLSCKRCSIVHVLLENNDNQFEAMQIITVLR